MKSAHARLVSVSSGSRSRAWIASFVTTIAVFTATNDSFALEPVPAPGVDKIHAGVALAVAGGLTAGLGTGIYMLNVDSGKTQECTPCGTKATVFPVSLMAIGSAMFVAGVTVGILGETQRRRAREPVPPTASITISPFGLSARLVF